MWYMVSLIHFPQNYVNVFHLTWIMSLHYLVKLEMLISHVLPLSCYKVKKLQNLSHRNCGLQFHQIWIQLITECEEYCKRRCIKHVSLIWTNWNSDWERNKPNWITYGLCGSDFVRVVGYQRASKPVLDILSTVTDFCHRTVSDFCCRYWQDQLLAICIGLFLHIFHSGVVM